MITDKHRLFYVNDKMEFALFYDASIKDPKVIVDSFLASKDFKCQAAYCGWKVKNTKISKDLKRVDITVEIQNEEK